MPDPLLPELARSLRLFGAPGDAATEAAHAAVLTPLLDARARAASSDLGGALAAMRGAALAARIESGAAAAAERLETDPARGRARAARARELLMPLRAELLGLDALAAQVHGASPTSPDARSPDSRSPDSRSPEWTAWVAALRRAFATADDACRGLARLLAERDEPPAPRRWFGRGAR
jgi:hypothetical protein